MHCTELRETVDQRWTLRHLERRSSLVWRCGCFCRHCSFYSLKQVQNCNATCSIFLSLRQLQFFLLSIRSWSNLSYCVDWDACCRRHRLSLLALDEELTCIYCKFMLAFRWWWWMMLKFDNFSIFLLTRDEQFLNVFKKWVFKIKLSINSREKVQDSSPHSMLHSCHS